MRGLLGPVGSALLALALLAPQARAASPELTAAVGSSLAVSGDPGSGGFAGTLGLLWPVEGRLAFGAALFVDDLGTGLGPLADPNTGTPLGTVATLHRWAFGGEWRGEATLHRNRRTRWLWGAGFGYARQERDTRGLVSSAVSSALASTNTTFLLQAAHGHAFGATIALRRAFVNRDADAGRSTSWATAALEWRWQGTPRE